MFTPDLQRLIVVADDVLILDGQTLEVLYQIPALHAARLAPDGKTLALINPDGNVEIWDVAIGQKLHSMSLDQPSDLYVHFLLSFSYDSRLVAMADGDRMRIWDVETGEQVQEFSGVGGSFSQVAGWFALSSGEEVVIYDSAWQPVYHWQIAVPNPSALVFSPDGKYLLASIYGYYGAQRYFFDLEAGQALSRDPSPANYYTNLDSVFWYGNPYSSDGRLMVTLNQNQQAGTLFSTEDSTAICAFEWTDLGEYHVSFSPDATRLAVSGASGVLKIFDTATCELLAEKAGFTYDYSRRAFASSDNRFIFLTGSAPTLLDAQTGEVIRTFDVGVLEMEPERAVFSPDSRYVALLDNCKIVSVDLTTGEVIATREKCSVLTYALRPGSPTLAVFYNQNVIDLLEIPSLEGKRLDYHFSGLSNALAFSPDGQKLAVANFSDISIIDIDSGQVSMSLETGFQANFLTYSPDGQYLAAALRNVLISNRSNIPNRLLVWRTADGETVLDTALTPELLSNKKDLKQEGFVTYNSVAFSPDNSYLLTTGLYSIELPPNIISPEGSSMVAFPLDGGEPLVRYNFFLTNECWEGTFMPDGRLILCMNGLLGVRQ